jgi:hypothetical protein
MCSPSAHRFVCVVLASLSWLPMTADATHSMASAVPATGSKRTYKPPHRNAKKVPRFGVGYGIESHCGTWNKGPVFVAWCSYV